MKDRIAVAGEFLGWFIGNKVADGFFDKCKVFVVDKLGSSSASKDSNGQAFEDERHIFVEAVLASGLFSQDQIGQIEYFLKSLHDSDARDGGERLDQFIHFIATGISRVGPQNDNDDGTTDEETKIEMHRGTVEFLKRILAKSNDEEKMAICEIYGIWKNSGVLGKLKTYLMGKVDEASGSPHQADTNLDVPISTLREKYRYKGFWRELLGLPAKKK